MNEDAYLAVSNAIDEKWHTLTVYERAALRFILQRTLRYGKTAEQIPRRHVLYGVPNTNQGPCGISYAQWKRCIRGLSSAGCIQFINSPEAGGLVIEMIVQRIVKGPMKGVAPAEPRG